MGLTIKFADATIAVNVSPLCTEARVGSCLAAHLEQGYDATVAPLSVADAGPLVAFLERGKYEPLSLTLCGVPRAEVECYRLFADAMPMHVPGLLRDIEDALRKRVLHGLATVRDVRDTFAGYDRVQGICDTLECLLPAAAPTNPPGLPLLLTRADLERALDDEGCLFIFHADYKMSIVFDMNYTEDGDDIPFFIYHWVRDIVEKCASTETPMVFSVSNPSGKRYVSFEATGPRDMTAVPSDAHMPLRELELLADGFFAVSDWQQTSRDGTDAPEFPAIHTIDAVVGTNNKPGASSVFVFARNDLWKFAVSGNSSDYDPSGVLGQMDRFTGLLCDACSE